MDKPHKIYHNKMFRIGKIKLNETRWKPEFLPYDFIYTLMKEEKLINGGRCVQWNYSWISLLQRTVTATWIHSLCDKALNCSNIICAFFYVLVMPQYNIYFKSHKKSISTFLNNLTTLGMLKLWNGNGSIFCWVITVYLEKRLIIYSTDTLEWF